MKVSLKAITGNWDLGYALDKHTISSTFIGNDEQGHAQFDTVRTDVGEALYKLKYRQDWTQVQPLVNAITTNIFPRFTDIGIIVPMPASKQRAKQPVHELSSALGKAIGIPVFENLLIKNPDAVELKNIHVKAEKLEVLKKRFSINDQISNQGIWNALLVDDLFDTGASLESACSALRKYKKVGKIYVVTLTWK